jgi:hypothetical protein
MDDGAREFYSEEEDMSEKERFLDFFKAFGIKGSPVSPKDVILEMEQDVEWASALSVGQVWFLFGQDDEYLGLLNDETMEFEAREN